MTNKPLENDPERPDTADLGTSEPTYSFIHQDLTPGAVMILFSAAVITGIGIKFLFGSFITIGYDDYRLERNPSNRDLVAIQKHLLAQGGSFAYEPRQVSGPACPDKKP